MRATLLFLALGLGCGGEVIVNAAEAASEETTSSSSSSPESDPCGRMCARWSDELQCPYDGVCGDKCADARSRIPACRHRYDVYLACMADELVACSIPETCMARWNEWAECVPSE